MNPNVFDHFLALVLVVLLPIYASRTYRRFLAEVRSGRSGTRLREYRITIAIQWLLAATTLSSWWLAGRSWAGLGFALPPGTPSWLGLAFTVVGLAMVLGQWVTVRRMSESALEGLRAQIEPVRDLLPETEAEYRGFRAVAVTAGICEELLYRGFLVAYSASFLGLWPAALVTGVVFGLAHYYQGTIGMVKTGVVGILVGALYAASGSLLWPMILHVAIDLQGGAIGRIALASPRARESALAET